MRQMAISSASTARAEAEDPRRGAKTLSKFAYEAIRQDILRGALAPGERLRVESLKDTYGVGAGTLREALTLLVGEALVTVEGQRGFRVAPISLEDFEDSTRVRKVLELEALRQSMELGDDEWEARVVAAFHRLSKVEEQFKYMDRATLSGEWEERNRAFHAALISASPSRWLTHFLEILHQQSERYRRIALAGKAVNRDVHDEHVAIKDAVLRRDVETACRLSAEHIDRTFEILATMFEKEAS